ncbi:cadherin-86C [Diachasmimorpha longicaudata]|uniref:cadherin-86C n=1 Tax=Diachasmimorpha longicaudata TaxID=58733 RepID=UPI0030B8E798
MPSGKWVKVWIYLNFVLGMTRSARPRFDTSTDMGMVLVPADAEIDSVIFRLRATDQDADFPLVFNIAATVSPVVRIENLPCTLYNKICQANVILTKRLMAGRLHDFAVRVKDSKGDSNSMQATISVTNATTQRDKIFPHIPAIIMVPEDAKPGKELDYIVVQANQWSGKPVYIELWQPKELFTIRQRQTPTQTRGVITLIGELDFETQSMYTLTIYATDPYTEPKKDTRNIAGLHLVVIVQDVQDVPPVFTHAPPLTKLNNTIQPGDVILRVHAEDGDKGVPREVTYGLVSEGNPFTPFFNISESTGEIILAKSLEELTQITHVGAPVVLSVVAEEIRRSPLEPPAQATVVEVGLLLGEPGNSPPYFENDHYIAWMDENPEPGSLVIFNELYSTRVKDEDIGKAGVFTLKLENNNSTFEISPTVAERSANFILSVRDNTLIDYEVHKSLQFKIVAQEVGPATNLSASVPVTIFLRDVNDNPPEFEEAIYKVTLSENVTAGARVVQVHATDKDSGSFGRIQYTQIIGPGSEAFVINPDTGFISVAVGANRILDREITSELQLTVEARDEDGKGLRGCVPFIITLLDVNDNPPIFEKDSYDFFINGELTNFTTPAIIKATDADAEPPNNEVRYELIHGNYDNFFILDEVTGEIFLRKQMTKAKITRHNPYRTEAAESKKTIFPINRSLEKSNISNIRSTPSLIPQEKPSNLENTTEKLIRHKRQDTDKNVRFTLTARAYDLGVPHLSSTTQINILQSPSTFARIVMFVVAGENPDPVKTAQTLATITGGHIMVKEIRPYVPGSTVNGLETTLPSTDGVKRSIVVARVESTGGTSLVDIDKIRAALAANGVGVVDGEMPPPNVDPKNGDTSINTTSTIPSGYNEEVTVYKAENKLLFWLLILLGLLILAAIIAFILCCICPGCPFYMAPRKRRIHSSETLVARSDGRPKRHIHRKYPMMMQDPNWSEKKQAWSADPMASHWQFNRRNTKQYGLASLPGDVVRLPDSNYRWPRKAVSLRADPHIPIPMNDPLYPTRQQEEHRMYLENIARAREYEGTDIDSLRKPEFERGSDLGRQQHGPMATRREHHFYREGNAEVMRLVTRDGMEETLAAMHRAPEIIIDQASGHKFDGKDILLRRFIEDQKLRAAGKEYQDGLQEDFEQQSMESHQRQRELSMQQQHQHREILVIPEKLDGGHHHHFEQLGPDVQRLIIDHGIYEKPGRSEVREHQDILTDAALLIPMEKQPLEKPKETSSTSFQNYTRHDLELATQNILLTRLLLERDGRVGASGVDQASYLETQSLPGQVAAGTQTDKTTATQTEHQTRSRSDNESEEESRIRKKMKFLKRYDEEPKRIRTLWIKSPIVEEERHSSGKRATVSRRKIRDIKDSRMSSIEPEVLREISDSLDENTETSANFIKALDSSNSQYESREEEEISKIDDSSSMKRTGITHRKGSRQDKQRMEKRKKTTKSRSDTASGPSFRILEKEMNSLSRKLSKLTGRKTSSGEDSGENEKQSQVQSKCETSQSTAHQGELKSKKIESKSDRKILLEAIQSMTKQHRKIPDQLVADKFKQKAKLRKVLPLSTVSSESKESADNSLKKSKTPAKSRESQKLKLAVGKVKHAKLKRQGKIDIKGVMKSMTEKLTKSEEERAITKSSSEYDYRLSSDESANTKGSEAVLEASTGAIIQGNKSLIPSDTTISAPENPEALKEILQSKIEAYPQDGDPSASSIREYKITESPKTDKTPNVTADEATMKTEGSSKPRVTSSSDVESTTSAQKEQSSAEGESLLVKPTNIVSTKTDGTQSQINSEEIMVNRAKSPIKVRSAMKKRSIRKRVRIADEKSEEDSTHSEPWNTGDERPGKLQLDRKSSSLPDHSPDEALVPTNPQAPDGNTEKESSEGIRTSSSNTSPGKGLESVVKSPSARSLTTPSVQSIRTTVDGIIEQATIVVSGKIKTATRNTDDRKDDVGNVLKGEVSHVRHLPEETERTDDMEDMKIHDSDVTERTPIVAESVENISRVMLQDESSQLSEGNIKQQEVIAEAIPTMTTTGETVDSAKLDPKISELQTPEQFEQKISLEETVGIIQIPGKNGNSDIAQTLEPIVEDSMDTCHTTIEEEVSTVESKTSKFTGPEIQRLTEESDKLPDFPNGDPISKGQSTVSPSDPPVSTLGIASPPPGGSLTLQQRVEPTPPVGLTVTSFPSPKSERQLHDFVPEPPKLVEDLTPTNDGLESLKSENLETVSIKSDESQSSKNVIISRETSFLNSPKRKSPTEDNYIDKSEKSDEKAVEDAPVTSEVSLTSKPSDILLPGLNAEAPNPEVSTEPSMLKREEEKGEEHQLSKSEGTSMSTSEEKLPIDPPLEESKPQIADLHIDLPSGDISTSSIDSQSEERNRKTELQDASVSTPENAKTDTLMPESPGRLIPELNINRISKNIDESSTLDEKGKEGQVEIPISKGLPYLPELSLKRLEEDSDISSQSSAGTTLIAQPYGTPRQKKMVPPDDMDSMDESRVTEPVSSEIKKGESSEGLKRLKPEEVRTDNIIAGKMEHTGETVQERKEEIHVAKKEFDVIPEQEDPPVKIADESTSSGGHNLTEEAKQSQVELIAKPLQAILPHDDGSTCDLLADRAEVTTSREQMKPLNIQKTIDTVHKMIKSVPGGYLKKIDEDSRNVPRKGRPTRIKSPEKECEDSKISSAKEKKLKKIPPEELKTSKLKKPKRQEPEKLAPLEPNSRITNDRQTISRKPERDKGIQPEKLKIDKTIKPIRIIKTKEYTTPAKTPDPPKNGKKIRPTLLKLQAIKKLSSSTELEKDEGANVMESSPDSSRQLPGNCDKINPIFQLDQVITVTTESSPTTNNEQPIVPSENIERAEKSTEDEITSLKTPDGASTIPSQLKNSPEQTTEAAKDEKFHQNTKIIPGDPPSNASKVVNDVMSSNSPHAKYWKEDTPEAQSRYMAWYKEMHERRDGENQEEPPKWLRKSTRQRWLKMSPQDRKNFDLRTPEITPRPRRKVKPSKNVESEQLKAIIRQGRRLRRAEGGNREEPKIEIFAPEKPPVPSTSTKYHNLIQHSEYKYEKIPPFYLHPPPVPHSSPQLSPQHFADPPGSCSTGTRCVDNDTDSGIVLPISTGSRLRHQQLLEKKSVFDIAYSEAAPSQLRADSTTPPS